ncbi:MAG: diphosphate--fructose-6-phosphate 1-phosphotransferase, partial [Simkaniaceae bacterium]|nr:diphosphate--fructose-6-phosphate 1-phosphotransferase [Simkaniaceae bacterium]
MDLQSFRQKYLPKIPEILKDIRALHPKLEEVTEPLDKEIEKLFTKTSRQPLLHFVKGEILDTKPLKIGVVFSGGQAPGGHNVIAGIFDALVQLHIDSELFGFLGGPKGIIDGDYKILNEETINPFRNIGGFNLIGSGRDKISTE